MKHVFTISCAAFMSLLFLATSCKKGDTGPAGPEGPAGPAGPQGPKGDTGVANVIYSGWLDVAFDAVTNTAGDTIYYYAAQIPAPKLTSTLLGQGEMKVYVNLNTVADPAVYPLPFNANVYIDVEFVPGNINLYSNVDAGTDGTGNNKSLQYRYVLIPGGTHARSAIDWNDYAKVKEFLGWKH